MGFRSVMSVFAFESARTLTLPRLFGWAVLALFPPATLGLATGVGAMDEVPDLAWGFILFYLSPEVVCLLGLLLWATPLVHSELEGKTWIYLAVRPGGRVSVLFGKYLTAVVWSATAAAVGATLSLAVIAGQWGPSPNTELSATEPVSIFRMWFVLMALIGLSCLAYGALYSFIAVTFHRRAMVVAVAYTMVLEFLVSFVPAMINQLTVQYRLRTLLVLWMGWFDEVDSGARDFLLGTGPAIKHVAVLALFIAIFLAASWTVLRSKQYVSAEEA